MVADTDLWGLMDVVCKLIFIVWEGSRTSLYSAGYWMLKIVLSSLKNHFDFFRSFCVECY